MTTSSSRGGPKNSEDLFFLLSKEESFFFLTGDFNAGGSRYNNFAGKGRKTERAT